MQNISQNNLLSMWLRYESKSQILSQKALDSLILKALFLQEETVYISIDELKKSLDIILQGDLSRDRIMESISGLIGNELEYKEDAYRLKSEIREKIQKQSSSSQSLHDDIYRRYFMGAVSKKDSVIQWFKWVLSEFFIRYYGEWMGNQKFKTIAQEVHDTNINSIITESFQKQDLELKESDFAYLRKHFEVFFREQSEKDSAKIFTEYGISCFSALLVYSSLFANKATIDAFKDATMILDTNILVTINLEDDKQNKLERLEKALKGLNISLTYVSETAGEYYRFAASMREKLRLHAYELETIYPRTVAIDAAIKLGCCDMDSVENFCKTQLREIPTILFEELAIDKYRDSDNDIEIICRDPKKRGEVEEKLNPILAERRRQKTEKARQHDISLLVATSYLLTKGKKIFILTYDKCIQKYTQLYPYQDTNYSLGLDALMAMLAIDGVGVDVNDTAFSTLFKQIINIETIPYDDTDDVLLDVYRVNTILNKIADLQPAISESLQQEVLNLRLSNVSAQEIALKMERKLDQVRKDRSDELEGYRSIISTMEEEIKELRSENASQKDYIVDGIRMKRIIWSSLIWVVILTAVVALFFLIHAIWADEFAMWQTISKVADIIGLLGFGGLFTLFKKRYILTYEWCKEDYIKSEMKNKRK